MIVSDKIAFLSKMLKDIYGSSSIGLKYENDKEVIIRNYGSINKEKLTTGKDSRFYRLFEYTFTNKEAKYSAECKRIKFERREIFKNAFDFLKNEFDLQNGLIPKVDYDTTDNEFNDMGKKLNHCYSFLLDMIFVEDEFKIDTYKPKINEILFDMSNNNSLEFYINKYNLKPIKTIFGDIEYNLKSCKAGLFDNALDTYYKRKEAFIDRAKNVIRDNESDMEIFYKSGSLTKYVDIKQYAQSKGLEIIDVNAECIEDYEYGNNIFRCCCECFFKFEKDKFILVSINLNGEKVSAFTSEKNWVNTSFVMNYIYGESSRSCICYFKYDKGKILQFLQIGDD